MSDFFYDLRHGLRTVRRRPGFAVVATITLALAIGVNSAIFSLVNALVFADLPMEDADRVVILRSSNPRLSVERGGFSLPDFLDYREQAKSLGSLAAWGAGEWIVTDAGEPRRVTGFEVTTNFLDVWGVPTAAGRKLLPDDGQPGAAPVALLSHGFWARQFGERPDVIGSTIRLNGTPHTVVGVVSPRMEFGGLSAADVWVPLQLDRVTSRRDDRRFFLTGRLLPSASAEGADTELKAIAGRLAETYPGTNRDWTLYAQSAPDSLLNEESKVLLFLLALTVGFVLLIACANIANMLLARASAREREFAVRSALGAARFRVVRQLLAESLFISFVSAGIGLGLSRLLMWGLVEMSGSQSQAFEMSELDGTVLLFTIGLAVVAPLVFGLLPALKASRLDLSDALREGGARSGGGRRGKLLRATLVGVQVALAVMLMVVSGILTRTVYNLQTRDLGFEPAGTMFVRMRLPERKYGEDDAVRRFFEEVQRRVETIPAAQRVALASFGPTSGGPLVGFDISGREIDDEITKPVAGRSAVSPGYFALTGVAVLQGREFEPADNEEARPVALISQEAVARYFPGEDPIGQRVRFEGADTVWYDVIGIVADLQVDPETGQPEPEAYVPFAQSPTRSTLVLLRSEVDPSLLAESVRETIWGLDAEQPIDDVRSYTQLIRDNNGSQYAVLLLFVSFAVFALVMAAVGIYGVMSYSVAQRTGEIGIRLALGATTVNVRRMIIGQGARIVIIGGAVGLLGAAALSRTLSSIVFGMNALDPITFISVPATLAIVGLIANYVPAVRATRISPSSALRTE